MSQPHAISGLGGIGKTQIAVEYAYRSHADYQAVFWVHADTRENAVSDFVTIAGLLQLPEQDVQDRMIVVHAVKQWLSIWRYRFSKIWRGSNECGNSTAFGSTIMGTSRGIRITT